MNQIKKVLSDYHHWIYIVLISVLLVLTFTIFKTSFPYLWFSIKALFHNFIYYCCKIFQIDYVVEKQPLDYLLEYHNGDYFSLLPIDWEVFKIKFKAFVGIAFNKEYIKYYLLYFIYQVLSISRYLILFIMILPLFSVINDFYLEPKTKMFSDAESFNNFNNEVFKKSKSLIGFERLRNRFLDPLREFIFNFIEFSKSHSFYYKIVLFVLAFDFKIISTIIDFFGFLFYFSSSIEFMSIFNFIATVFVYLSPVLIKIPLPVYLVVGYYLFDRWRISIAFNTLYHNENKNKGFIKSLGILSMFVGPPGVGKTTMLTDLTLSQEEIFRTDLLNIITDIRSRFSMFPFSKFETNLNALIDSGIFVNRVQCADYVRKKKERFEFNNCNEKIFDYDYERYGLYFYDGKVNEYIWDALSDYAEAYFMYITNSPLSTANYSIRFDMQKIDYGYFPLWNYDYFQIDGNLLDYRSRFSKVLDQDSLRLGKKMVPYTENAFVLDGCVITHPEVGKERGNQYDLAELKMSDNVVNQKNDLFNSMIKIIRHLSTVRHIPFIRFFDDDQRSASTNADLRELHDMIVTLKNTEDKFETCIPMYWFLPIILDKILKKLESFEKRYSNARYDETLLIYFVRNIINKVKKFQEYRQGIFNVKKVHMSLSSGNSEDNLGEKVYYLSEKKIYSNRYNTDSYGAFFKDKFMQQKKGFKDLEEYDSYVTKLDKLVAQNSYFVKRIVGLNTSEELKTEVEKIYRKLI